MAKRKRRSTKKRKSTKRRHKRKSIGLVNALRTGAAYLFTRRSGSAY